MLDLEKLHPSNKKQISNKRLSNSTLISCITVKTETGVIGATQPSRKTVFFNFNFWTMVSPVTSMNVWWIDWYRNLHRVSLRMDLVLMFWRIQNNENGLRRPTCQDVAWSSTHIIIPTWALDKTAGLWKVRFQFWKKFWIPQFVYEWF